MKNNIIQSQNAMYFKFTQFDNNYTANYKI